MQTICPFVQSEKQSHMNRNNYYSQSSFCMAMIPNLSFTTSSYNAMGWKGTQILSHLSGLFCCGHCFYKSSQLMSSHWPNFASQFPLGVHYGKSGYANRNWVYANERAKRVLFSASQTSFSFPILCAVHQDMVSISSAFHQSAAACHSHFPCLPLVLEQGSR